MTYFIDTCSLLECANTRYPFEYFSVFWDRMEQAILEEEVIVIREVFEEVKANDENLHEWLKQYR